MLVCKGHKATMGSFLETETVLQLPPSTMTVFCHFATAGRCRKVKPRCFFDVLHDGILLNIQERLSHPSDLQAWALSCKRLYALEAVNRKRLSLLRLHMFPALAQRYSCMEHLDLSSCTFLSDAGLRCVGLYAGKRLRSINLSTVSTFSDLGLSCLARECTTLLHLDLSKCSQVHDRGIVALAHIHSLQSLNLSNCADVSDASLSIVALNCRNLQSFLLKWCVGVTDNALLAIGAYCINLKELDVSFTEITNASVYAICKLMYLEKLSLAACSWLDDEGLMCLKNGSKSLQILDVSRCRGVTYRGIMEVANSKLSLKKIIMSYCSLVADPLLQSFAKLKDLHVIQLDGCSMSAVSLELIGKCCSNLEELSLSKCKGITDSGLTAVVAGCCNLKSIDLTCCRDITDIGLASIALSCTGLFSLKMESCSNISKHGLQKLGNSCQQLEELDLTDSSLTDAGLMCIANCKYLITLKIGICEGIGDTGLSYIASGCSRLRHLDLYRSVAITDKGIAAICTQCTKLVSMNMSYCTQITDAGLFAVAQLPELRSLELRGCTELSSRGLIAVARKCIKLVKLDMKRCTSVEEYVPLVLAQYSRNLRQVNLSYCSATDDGVIALAQGRCMQQMKLVHVHNISVSGFSKLLLAGESLKKVKLLAHLKDALPLQLIQLVESRGCLFRWMDKL